MAIRIGFDAKRIFHNNTGLGNYGRTLVRNLITHQPDIEVFLFTPSINKNADTNWFLSQANIHVVAPEVGVNTKYWRSIGIKSDIKRYNLDIFHGLSNELPIGKLSKDVRWVVTIHDVIFATFPQQYNLIDRWIYSLKTKSAINKADAIVSISQSTSRDLMALFNAPENKITTLYQSCGENFTFKQPTTKDYFLFVSGINKRKGLSEILQAMRAMRAQHAPLLKVVGSGGAYEQTLKKYIIDNNLESQVDFLGNVSNTELHDLYVNAIALVYPSYAEGFGIPIIEALSSGTHVITSNISAMPESGGPLAHYITPGNIDELKNMMIQIQDEPPLTRDDILKHTNTFNSENTANQLMQFYTDLKR